MIDIHCHLLPGIDDGPKTMEDSLNLCRIAVDNGITKAVATPHITPGRYDNTLESIAEVFNQFRSKLEQANIDLEVGVAAEVRLDPVILDMVKMDTMPFLGEFDGEPVMLLEFPHTHIPPGSGEHIAWLRKEGVLPIIAHPERNKDVMNKLSKIKPFVDAGCLLQVTAGSLAGVFGDIPRKRGIELLKKGWVTILASDAHNLRGRLPDIEQGRVVAEKIVGKEEAWNLVEHRPAQISAKHFS